MDSNLLLMPHHMEWGMQGSLIQKVALGDWAMDITVVQIPTPAPPFPLLGGVGRNIDKRILKKYCFNSCMHIEYNYYTSI